MRHRRDQIDVTSIETKIRFVFNSLTSYIFAQSIFATSILETFRRSSFTELRGTIIPLGLQSCGTLSTR